MLIDDFIKNVDSIVISGHIRPDGDCTGSVLALYNYLVKNYPEKRTDVYLEDPGDKYGFLKGYRQMDHDFESDVKYDLMIALDTSTPDRLGMAEKYFDSALHRICIDHHISNQGYADENYIYGDLSSASETLFHFLDKGKMDKDIAECLYVGIISDTGLFKYPSTSPETMRIAAELMEFGLDTDSIMDRCFYEKTFDELRVVGFALMRSRHFADGKGICSYITRQEMDDYNVTTRELESIVSSLRQVRGCLCAVFIYETGDNEYKVSFRSKDPLDVNKIAVSFGGGGHIHASGCSLRGELDSCMEAVLAKTCEAVRELERSY